MIRLRVLALFFFLVNFYNVFSMQASDYVKHQVEKGQTIYAIGRLYQVSPVEILKLNPDAKNGIEVGQIILVPKSTGAVVIPPKPTPAVVETVSTPAPKPVLNPIVAPNTSEKTHTVEPKETLYGLSRKFGVTVDELKAANPMLAEGLKVGQALVIPVSGAPVKNTVSQTPTAVVSNPATVKTTTTTVKNEVVEPVKKVVTESAPKAIYETQTTNPISSEIVLNDPSKLYDRIINKPILNDLLKSANKNIKKELVMLLPFNLAKIQNDSVGNLKSHLSKDKFLNMTLDFYSGALMAIDSAGKIGLKINVRIIDSEESQAAVNISKVISNHDFSKVNGIIGPFRQSNIEIVAEALKSYNIPIISPLSKESSKLGFANLYNSIPPTEVLRKSLINYIKYQNANVIAVVDVKKVSIKKYLSDNFPGIKFATVDETNKLVAQSLKEQLDATKQNFVILETEKANLILSTINTLTEETLGAYKINLATMDRNPTFDHEEIPLSKLVKLNLHYPSVTKEDGTQNNSKFSKRYKKENTVFPNQYAVRGFDLTFDAILRMAQDVPFGETVDKFATEYIENRFSYDKDLKGGYFNRGVYVLKYNADYTITELK